MGVFSKIYKELKRFERRVRRERNRFFRRVSEELARWEDKGPFGKFLASGAKYAITGALSYLSMGAAAGVLGAYLGSAATSGGVLSGLSGMAPTLGAVMAASPQQYALSHFFLHASYESPWQLSEEEWKMLAQIAAALGSAVLTICSGGAAAPLLVSTVISVANTAITAQDVIQEINAREEIIEQLKRAKTMHEFENRVRREAISKLKADIRVMNEYVAKKREVEAKIADANRREDEVFERMTAKVKAYQGYLDSLAQSRNLERQTLDPIDISICAQETIQ